MSSNIQIVVAANNDQVLNENLLRSPDLSITGMEVLVENDCACAGAAYNAGLDRSSADYVAFIHQDVFLPAGWPLRLQGVIEELERSHIPWGILGVWGIASSGKYCGRVWCTGGNHAYRGADGIQEAASIDEIVIVLKRSSGLRFDEKLPGFHLYATDIVMEARKRGLKTFVFDGPVIHNSRANPQPLDKHYWAAYRYMQRKWATELPLPTCVVPVTRSGWPLWKQWAKNEIRQWRGRFTPHPRLADPAAKARELGYDAADVSQGSVRS